MVGSLARAFLGLSLVGLYLWKLSEQTNNKLIGISHLGTKTSSLSDSQLAKARFFPPAPFTGDGVGGGVISILWRRGKKSADESKMEVTYASSSSGVGARLFLT